MFYSTIRQNGRALSAVNKIEERKKIVIGNDVFIGANVTVLDGVTIGDGAIIGAGAVVSKDIPPYAIAVGCPINVIKYRFSPVHIDRLLRIRWWEFSNEKLQDVEKYFFDVESFIQKYDTKT
jgi:acetyltransferase-like isoleucine patch superfamily enzyme